MYQESEDKINGSAVSDAVLVIAMIAAFFLIGGFATWLKTVYTNDLPLYIFALLCALCVYIIYRLRILGHRYTVFYEEPQPEYDPRFDDYITHEDHPYPVGTFVAERIVSAKGAVIDTVDKSEMIALLEPGAAYDGAVKEINCSSKRKSRAHSLVYEKDGVTYRMYIAPSEEMKGHINALIESKNA